MSESSYCKTICETMTLSWLDGYALETKTVCRGCGRTEYEVEEWFNASPERKVLISERARGRMKKGKH